MSLTSSEPRTGASSRGLVSLLLVAACSSQPTASASDIASANDTGRTVSASNDVERAVLAEVSKLPSDAPTRVRGVGVEARKPYSAASGRTCRQLRVTPAGVPSRERLVCTDGGAWFFVPEVFGDATSAE